MNARAANGATPLVQRHLKGVNACCPEPAVLLVLLDAGADVMARDDDDQTSLAAYLSYHERSEAGVLQGVAALIQAAGRLGKVEELVNAGGIRWCEGEKALGGALMAAVSDKKPSLVALLLGCGADVGAVDGEGRTALHHVGNEAVAQMLVGVHPGLAEVVDKGGRTPAQLAREEGYEEVAAAIESPYPTARLLQLFGSVGEGAQPLVDRVLSSRLPLTEQEWGEVLASSPAIVRECLLPAAMSHSEAQAGCLVRCMCSADRQRLRTAALCLGRAQRECELTLPAHVVQGSLAHFAS